MTAEDQDERIKKLEDELEALKQAMSLKRSDEDRDFDLSLEEKLNGLMSQIRSQDAVFSRKPTFALGCRPTGRIQIRGLFGGFREDVVKFFDNPPALASPRESGSAG